MATYNPQRSIGIIGWLFVLAIVGGGIFLLARANVHNILIKKIETDAVLNSWEGQRIVNPITEFAQLPAHDRALIEQRCTKVVEDQRKLLGTQEVLKPDYEPACQALIRGGWHPQWTVRSYFSWIAQ